MVYNEVKVQYGEDPLDTSNNGTTEDIMNSQTEIQTT
jgi:hypothetical protein